MSDRYFDRIDARINGCENKLVTNEVCLTHTLLMESNIADWFLTLVDMDTMRWNLQWKKREACLAQAYYSFDVLFPRKPGMNQSFTIHVQSIGTLSFFKDYKSMIKLFEKYESTNTIWENLQNNIMILYLMAFARSR